MAEKAILIGIITPDISQEQAYEYLDELSFLAKTAGAKPIRNFTQKLPHPDNKTFLGKGKIQEVFNYAKENQVSLIIFDDDLSKQGNSLGDVPVLGNVEVAVEIDELYVVQYRPRDCAFQILDARVEADSLS